MPTIRKRTKNMDNSNTRTLATKKKGVGFGKGLPGGAGGGGLHVTERAFQTDHHEKRKDIWLGTGDGSRRTDLFRRERGGGGGVWRIPCTYAGNHQRKLKTTAPSTIRFTKGIVSHKKRNAEIGNQGRGGPREAGSDDVSTLALL